MPFDEDEKIIKPNKRGLKNVSPKQSMFDNIPKKPSQQDLDNKVQDIVRKSEEYKSRMANTAKSYLKLLKDKTLTENQTIFSKSFEQDVLKDITNLAITINNDQDEDEGMGSISLCSLLLKCLLIQRNEINNLSYKLQQLSILINKNDTENNK